MPYILAKEIEGIDYIVGLDISRVQKKNRKGTVNIAASTRIYAANGEFLSYHIQDAKVEGETPDKATLERFFSYETFANKKVVIHRDGLFRGDQKCYLEEHAKAMNTTFYFVEIVKSGIPRLYREENNIIQQAKRGDGMYLDKQSAIVVTTDASVGTIRPLLVRSTNLDIKAALQSVLYLNILHYGSTRLPRIPVSTFYADKIAEFAIKGILPKNKEGTSMYWL